MVLRDTHEHSQMVNTTNEIHYTDGPSNAHVQDPVEPLDSAVLDQAVVEAE